MSKKRFNNFYETEYTSWELNRPDSNLVDLITTVPILPRRVMELGCFHSFDTREDRQAFAQNAHAHLKEKGQWLSFLGNADAGPISKGPPVRSAMDIVRAVEPYFENIFLQSGMFDSEREKSARSWHCLMQKRLI